MTVAELIERLSREDPDAPVLSLARSGHYANVTAVLSCVGLDGPSVEIFTDDPDQ